MIKWNMVEDERLLGKCTALKLLDNQSQLALVIALGGSVARSGVHYWYSKKKKKGDEEYQNGMSVTKIDHCMTSNVDGCHIEYAPHFIFVLRNSAAIPHVLRILCLAAEIGISQRRR